MRFSQEVCEKLGYYVYRLVDPRNGETFYVGKGRNNRVFAHTERALSPNSDVDYNPELDDDENLKYKTIRLIEDVNNLTEELVDIEELTHSGHAVYAAMGKIVSTYQQLLADRNYLDFSGIQTEA